MKNKTVALVLGALTGLVGLIAMVRLVSAAFAGSTFALIFVLLAMVPWVAYVAYRARHGRLAVRGGVVVLVLGVAGLVGVWLFTLGPVIALACSLAAFAVIWISDWPPKRPRSESRFVRIDELTAEETDPV